MASERRREIRKQADGTVDVVIIESMRTPKEIIALHERLKGDLKRAKAIVAQMEEELADLEQIVKLLPKEKG